MDYIKVRSKAKINLVLDVLKKRDDGFHELEMIMQTLNLYDSLFIKKTDGHEIKLKSNLSYLPTDERNIAVKAAKLMIERFSLPGGVFIDITKRIPVAAGLAGGSGNCAAVLKGMNQLYDLGLSMEELMEIGLILGSDVPFCLMEGTALARGRGEILTPLPSCPPFYVVLAKPPIGVSTAFVYKNLDLKRKEDYGRTEQMVRAIEKEDRDYITKNLYNTLESVTLSHKPIVRDMKKYLEDCGGDGVLMSGSGPTVFALFKDRHKARKTYEMTRNKFKLREVYLTEISRD